MMLILQSLLTQRFKLSVHRENRDLRVYALTIGKNGSKLARAKDEERETLLQRRRDESGCRGLSGIGRAKQFHRPLHQVSLAAIRPTGYRQDRPTGRVF